MVVVVLNPDEGGVTNEWRTRGKRDGWFYGGVGNNAAIQLGGFFFILSLILIYLLYSSMVLTFDSLTTIGV